MPAAGGMFGAGSVASQFLVWSVAAGIAAAMLSPEFTAIQQEMWQALPVKVIPPEALAELVVRGFVPEPVAAIDAAKSGTDAAAFHALVELAGDAPAPGELAVALRRGLIPETGTDPEGVSFDQGIREGRLADKYTAMIKELAVQWPTPNDALDALLEGQVDEATAQALYAKFGGNPDYFRLLFDTRGTAPTPNEALELVRRGIIPLDGTGPDATSYTQAFLEGPWRNKWLKPFEGLLEYVPPPRTVTALERSGAITPEQAQTLYQKSGLTPELAAAYAKSASHEKLAGTKQLAQGVVLNLYEAQGITGPEATAYLTAMGYDSTDIVLLLSYADLQRELRALNSAVTRIGTLYVARKITRQAAATALTALDVQPAHARNLLTTWDTERAATVKALTEAQIVAAVHYGNMTNDEAMGELENIGYTPYDSWVLLSNRNQSPLPNKPARGPGGPGVNP